MKRYIHSNNSIKRDDVLIEDKIYIDIEVNLDQYIAASQNIHLFPGVDQFRQDVAEILEKEYKFEVVEDIYDGVRQKGYCSNREDSESIYFDTYFDLSNGQDALDRLGVTKTKAPDSGLVYCFIHIRFSSHTLNDAGDTAHRNFIDQNEAKYLSRNHKVTHSIKEAEIEVSESDLYRYYDRAIFALKGDLDAKILSWIYKLELYKLS